MTRKKLDWKADVTRPTGKGAVKQRFTSREGQDDLEIDTTPWGDGNLTVNRAVVAQVTNDGDAGQAFRDLEVLAEEYEDAKARGGEPGKRPAKT
ncbi:hypothetical protein [Oceanibacterium hippocampi]|uniref:Uncharacterized protein n=1 Tax=Oceanibacterium hippocampi TaxID=745714 RepID=A0A1Y5TR73_9PROT|nr:hypothetical protein [Oceanibacterium hippocampi]SLN66245.1 hypothetical protein OCH7691_03042 [Oceanibacterium hippocampi]